MEGWHKINIVVKNADGKLTKTFVKRYRRNIIEWLKDNVADGDVKGPMQAYYNFKYYFKREEDAVNFGLRWIGMSE